MSDSRATIFRLFPGIGVAAGRIRDVESVNVFGHNNSIGLEFETLWNEGGLYADPTSPLTLQISSSSSNDVDGGTGARKVEIFGLDVDFDPINEIVNLNGQNQVATTKQYRRCFSMIVRSAGIGAENEGIVYAGFGAATAGKPALVISLVEAGLNQALMCHYTIRAGYTGYAVKLAIESSITKEITADFVVRPPGEVYQVKQQFNLTQDISSQDFEAPIKIDEKSDLEFRAKADPGGTGDLSARISLILVRN